MNKENLPFSFVHLLCMILSLILSILSLFSYKTGKRDLYILIIVSGIAAIIFGLIYFFLGYKKAAAGFYKLFLLFYLIESSLNIIYDIISANTSILPCRGMIMLIIIFFIVVKDLGRIKSLVLTVLLSLLSLAVFIQPLLRLTINAGSEIVVATPVNYQNLAEIMLAVSAGLMVFAKYTDKESRGRD